MQQGIITAIYYLQHHHISALVNIIGEISSVMAVVEWRRRSPDLRPGR